MKVIMLADDLTGAMDTGVQLARQGIPVYVAIGNRIPPEIKERYQVVVMDLESRHSSPEEAENQIRKILEEIQDEWEYLYLKTDSVLRGNLSAVFHQVRRQLGEQIVFVPFFPENGRTTRDGMQYVNGVPVQESSFARDPQNPIRTGSIREILNESRENPVCFRKRGQFLEEKAGSIQKTVMVLEGETGEDMSYWAGELRKNGVPRVMAGCAGFAGSLPELAGLQRGKRQKIRIKGPALILSGSANETSFRQLEYAERAGTPVFLMEKEGPLEPLVKRLISTLSRGQSVIAAAARCQSDVQAGPGSHEQLQKRWSQLAGLLWEDLPGRVGVIGGDTCLAVLGTLGITGMEPLDQLQPGVPVSVIRCRGREIVLMTKSGGLGDEKAVGQMIRGESGEEQEERE